MKTFKTKRFGGVLLGIMLLVSMAFLSACGSDDDDEQITLTMSWWGGDSRHEAVQAALDIFMERYPHITVDTQFGAFGGYLDSLILQLSGNTTPDIVQSNFSWIHTLGGGQNVFLDLNEVSHIIDFSEWGDLLEFARTADGEIAAVPHGMTGRVMIYNRPLLDEFGVATFPQTFDELIALGERVSAANTAIDTGENRYIFFPFDDVATDIMLLTMLYNETGRVIVQNYQIQYSIDEVEQMFNILGRMIDSGTIPSWEQSEAPFDATNPVWMQGRGGSAFEWVGNIFLAGNNFAAHDGVYSLGVALLPAVAPGAGQAIMQRPSLVHAISRTTNHPEEAALLLNFLYTDEEALVALGNEFGIPLSRSAAAISAREGNTVGLQLEGLHLLEAYVGDMGAYFEDPNLRPPRLHAIEGLRTGHMTARQAAEYWVNQQQVELNAMNQ